MQIIDALKALHQKVASKAASSGSIAGVINELAQNWPTPSASPGAATPSKAGLVKQAASVAAAAGDTPTKAEFDGLITALKNAGIMANP